MSKINLDELKSLLASGKFQVECSKHFGCSEVAISKAVKKLKAAAIPKSMEKLSDKKRLFVLNLAEGKNPTSAAMASFDCTPDSAKTLGCRLVKEEEIMTAVSDLMASEGITRRRRIQRLKDLIESNDLGAVSRGLDMSWKLEGAYAPERVSVEVDHVQLKVDLNKAIEAMRKEQGLEPGEVIDIPKIGRANVIDVEA